MIDEPPMHLLWKSQLGVYEVIYTIHAGVVQIHGKKAGFITVF
jgi:hypothetical protein